MGVGKELRGERLRLRPLGPVFAFEWLTTARRWQTYAMRSATVLLLLGTEL